MGSKNLKMLALKGNKKIPYHDKAQFLKIVKEYNKEKIVPEPGRMTRGILKMVPRLAKFMRRTRMGMKIPPGLKKQVWRNLGTAAGNTLCAETGDSPVKNWNGIGMLDFPYSKAKNISALELQKYKVKNYGCYSCPVQCGAILIVPELNLEETHLPEYETCAAFGSLLLNDDLMSILELNDICNREGVDTISLGGTIAFAIECFENGILNKENMDGLDLTWGNSETILKLAKKIIKREGIGELFADGSKKASEKIGRRSEQFLMNSFGCEIAMHNPRKYPSLAYSYAYDPTPGNHNAASIDFMEEMGPMEKFAKGLKLPKSWHSNINQKQKAQVISTSFTQVINSTGLCLFATLFGEYPLLDLINSLIGWYYSYKDYYEIGLRIQNQRQAFSIREGIILGENELPGRIVGYPPDQKGPNKNITAEYKNFYKGYCEKMGWNEEGIPLPETLEDLGLNHLVNDLYGKKNEFQKKSLKIFENSFKRVLPYKNLVRI